LNILRTFTSNFVNSKFALCHFKFILEQYLRFTTTVFSGCSLLVHLFAENSGDSVVHWRSSTYRPQDNGILPHSSINSERILYL